MKYELPCAIVRDLLPSYVEGLTEEETTTAVHDHLERCESCRSRYEAMTGGEAVAVTEEKEVDYLKTVRKKNRKKVVLAALLAALLVLGGVGVKLCLIGFPAEASSFAVRVKQEQSFEDHVTVSLHNMDSASSLIDLRSEEKDGIIDITARTALGSPFHRSGDHSVPLNVKGIREIRFLGETVWKDGMEIDIMTQRLMRHKTAYTGDAPAVNMLLSDMDLDSPFTLELQTEKEPYGVTLHFSQPVDENRRFMVEGNAYVLLALVDNLGEVRWDDPSGYCDSLTLDEANAAIPGLVESYNMACGTDLLPLGSVKDYGADSYGLQLLRNLLGI